MSETAICWFRRDCRLHDHEALDAVLACDELLPVYCVDPRDYGTQPFGGHDSFDFDKTGSHRSRFRLESLADLREAFRARGSDLVVREGRPEDVLPELASEVDADVCSFHTVPTPEEVDVEAAVKHALRSRDVRVERSWGHTLHHLNDLPVPYTDIPDTFTPFRTQVERDSTVRATLGTPDSIPTLPEGVDAGAIPTLADLGVAEPPEADRGDLAFEGGESAGLDRLESYIWEGDHLREYKRTRNGLVGADYSSKLSPWLNEGCLSPRRVFETVERYEDERVSNDSTYWLVFELRWRDFFAFQFAKHGATFFTRGGIRERTDIDWAEDGTAFERWTAGETGVPFVDAAMRELNRTGYVSNRARQNAASFLANNLRVDWRRGAAYFETRLVDYDPASNYGNWAYIAGVGNDSRDRYFDVVEQARRYDAEAAYVKHWLPELDALPPEYAHEPWTMQPEDEASYGVALGADYPRPVVDLEASYEKLR